MPKRPNPPSPTGEPRRDEEVSFVADARLISVLGEQLIGSERVGVLELIKNSYDAGARVCTVTLEGVPGLEPTTRTLSDYSALRGPVIEVRDDGKGMSREDLVDGWLRPASARRAQLKERLRRERESAEKRGAVHEYDALVKRLKREHGGRLPLGEKGVGRLATHRLGNHLWLRTKTADEDFEWELRIDWDVFDRLSGNLIDLSSVKLKLVQQPVSTDYGNKNSGTVICCYGGREGYAWTRDAVVDLGRAISALRSPRQAPAVFEPRFDSPHVSSFEIASPLERVSAPFELVALIDESGCADVDYTLSPPTALAAKLHPVRRRQQLDLRAKAAQYWKTPAGDFRKPACGAFLVHIRAWLRLKDWLGPDLSVVTEYLDEFGGLTVYRDGMAALPAQQTAKGDWLGLAMMQIKKSSNISYYHMLGEVELAQEHTLALRDRSSREGMIETAAYHDLVVLLRGIVAELQSEMQAARDHAETGGKAPRRVSRAEARKSATTAQTLAKALEDKYDFKKDPLGITPALGGSKAPAVIADLSSTVEALADQVRSLETERDGLLEAAGFGIAVGVAVHELAKLATAVVAEVKKLDALVGADRRLRGSVVNLHDRADSLLAEVKRLAPLRVTRAEAARPVSIKAAINTAAGAFDYTMKKERIALSVEGKDFTILGRHGAVSQVFANLLDNAVYWVATVKRERAISIAVDAANREVRVADSGPGVSERMEGNLFQPFYSEKDPPSGLGLYICRYYLSQFGAGIRLSARSEPKALGGAQFILDFSKSPSPEPA